MQVWKPFFAASLLLSYLFCFHLPLFSQQPFFSFLYIYLQLFFIASVFVISFLLDCYQHWLFLQTLLFLLFHLQSVRTGCVKCAFKTAYTLLPPYMLLLLLLFAASLKILLHLSLFRNRFPHCPY